MGKILLGNSLHLLWGTPSTDTKSSSGVPSNKPKTKTAVGDFDRNPQNIVKACRLLDSGRKCEQEQAQDGEAGWQNDYQASRYSQKYSTSQLQNKTQNKILQNLQNVDFGESVPIASAERSASLEAYSQRTSSTTPEASVVMIFIYCLGEDLNLHAYWQLILNQSCLPFHHQGFFLIFFLFFLNLFS